MNILLIVLDACRADRLGCYGYSRDTSPNMDALAREGILFPRAYSSCAWTYPSTASILTGYYPVELGLHNSYSGRLPEVPTLAESLKHLGYATYAVNGGNSWISEATGLNRGFDVFHMLESPLKRLVHNDAGAHWVTKTARSIISHASHKPFFLYLHYLETHDYMPTPKFYYGLSLSDLFIPRPGKRKFLRSRFPRVPKDITTYKAYYKASKYVFTAHDRILISDLYDNMLFYMDYKIGELFAVLREAGIWDDTCVILTADHGENLGERGELTSHQFSVYNEVIKIPLIVKLPVGASDPMKTGAIVQNTQIAPTLYELVKDRKDVYEGKPCVPSLSNMDGESYAVTEWCKEPPEVYSQRYSGLRFDEFPDCLWAVIGDQYKLIIDSDGHQELYNIENDPCEQTNIAGQHLEQVKALLHYLEAWKSKYRPTSVSQDQIQYDHKLVKKLRGLGYL